MELEKHIERQKEFSLKTFGGGLRTLGITNHIRKELIEVESEPEDLLEWVDVIAMAVDGAWRIGASAYEIASAMEAKLAICKNRNWPPVDENAQDSPVEHVRSERGKDWKKFADSIYEHIENYTVPQYGDKGEDQASEYGSAEHILQAKRYLARYGKNSRPGQEVLDLKKVAHYIQMAAMELEKEIKDATR